MTAEKSVYIIAEIGPNHNGSLDVARKTIDALAAAGLEVAEYAPNHVKKSVVGVGHADKHQIMAMIGILLPKCELDSADSADALAVAITHAHHRGQRALQPVKRKVGA